MYKNTPKIQNGSAKACSLICLLVGAALWILSGAEFVPLTWLVQLCSIIFFAASIYMASLYLLRLYTFSVEQNDKLGGDNYDFIITERKGKKETVVCRISLDDIVKARIVDKENKKTVERERKKMKCYTYDVQFLPSRQIEITSRWDDDMLSVMITYDEQLLEIIKSNIK